MDQCFDASLDWHDLLIEPDELPPDAPVIRQALQTRLAQFGAVILNGCEWSDPHQMQLRLPHVFGSVGRHNRANQDGIVTITPLAGYDDYLGASNLEHPLHTDGPFERIQPLVMSLLCDLPALEGGETTLVSSKAAYLHLLNHEPESLRALFDDDAFYIRRGGQAVTVPMFRVQNNRIHLAFRYDGVGDVSIKPSGQRAFDTLLAFLQDPKNVAQFTLPGRHLLVCDNGSVLHGRRAFPEHMERRMLRLNMNGGAFPEMDAVLGFEAPLPWT
jgi:alpha-ketoglutarate-dependent taurine dioxygenase